MPHPSLDPPGLNPIHRAACATLRVELAHVLKQIQQTTDVRTLQNLLKQAAVLEIAIQNCPAPSPPKTSPPDLSDWLAHNPKVTGSILWQKQAASPGNAYVPPAAGDKVAWVNWTPTQKAQLEAVYLDCCIWLDAGAPSVLLDPPGLTDTPQNVDPGTSNDLGSVIEKVSATYMWEIYLAHVGFALAAELTNLFPWKIAAYNALELRYVFDSTTMAWLMPSGEFWMGTYDVYVPALRADNRPQTAFAPPEWSYRFLKQNGLIGASKIETIGLVLEWARQHLVHFYGAETFGTCDNVWHYRGFPPISRVTGGTIDSANPGLGPACYTMGCHGTVGFLNAILRAVNIPVQPIWVAGHELACFLTEGKYLDHGDDPYNSIVRASSQPILEVLIDEATYQARFTTDLTANIVDLNSPALAYVGYSAVNFPP